MTRRGFLRALAGAAGALAVPPRALARLASPAPKAAAVTGRLSVKIVADTSAFERGLFVADRALTGYLVPLADPGDRASWLFDGGWWSRQHPINLASGDRVEWDSKEATLVVEQPGQPLTCRAVFPSWDAE